MVEMLVAAKADVNAKMLSGVAVDWTPLHAAAACGHTPIARLLIDNGADVNARVAGRSYSGHTPLHLAAAFSRRAVVELLISRGADVNAKTTAGFFTLARTPLDLADDASVREVLMRHGGKPARPAGPKM